jgi:hypothetical protein
MLGELLKLVGQIDPHRDNDAPLAKEHRNERGLRGESQQCRDRGSELPGGTQHKIRTFAIN